METRQLILYIATSADGYIADDNGELNFLATVAREREDYGYHDFMRTVDTVMMGRKTYDHVLATGYDYPQPNTTECAI